MIFCWGHASQLIAKFALNLGHICIWTPETETGKFTEFLRHWKRKITKFYKVICMICGLHCMQIPRITGSNFQLMSRNLHRQRYQTSQSHTMYTFNTLRPRQNDCHFPDDIFICFFFFNENDLTPQVRDTHRYVCVCVCVSVSVSVSVDCSVIVNGLAGVQCFANIWYNAGYCWLLDHWEQIALKFES